MDKLIKPLGWAMFATAVVGIVAILSNYHDQIHGPSVVVGAFTCAALLGLTVGLRH